jgi:hypothetical protein
MGTFFAVAFLVWLIAVGAMAAAGWAPNTANSRRIGLFRR